MLHLCTSGGKAAAPVIGDENGDSEVRGVQDWDLTTQTADKSVLLMRQLAQRQQQHEARIEQLLMQHHLQVEEVLTRALAGHPEKYPRGSRRGSTETRIKESDVASEYELPTMTPAVTPRVVSSCVKTRSLAEKSLAEESSVRGVDSSPSRISKQKLEKMKSTVQQLDTSISQAESNLRSKRQIVSKVRDSDSFSNLALAICRTHFFEYGVGSLILLNAISIGAFAEWSMGHIGEPSPAWVDIINICFMICFSIELMIRFLAEGWTFFRVQEGNGTWNMFDMFLVCLSVVDTVATISWNGAPNMTIIRVLRVSRLFRAVRVIRIARFFSDLRTLVIGIMNCGKMLMWSALLLFIIMYIYGVCIMQAISYGLSDGSLSKEQADYLVYRYGTVADSIYTLFKALLGGISWGEVSDPLTDISPFLLLAFCTYIAFAMTCVLNIITGIFVDKAKDFRSDEKMIADYVEGLKRQIDTIKNLFRMQDDDGSGLITKEEFSKVFYDLSSQAYFESVGLEVSGLTAEEVFDRFDADGDGTLNIDEFATGIAHLRGSARKFDVQYLLQLTQGVVAELKELRDVVQPPTHAIQWSA